MTLPRTAALALALAVVGASAPAAAEDDPREYHRATTGETGQYLYWRDRHISYVVDSEGCPDMELGQAAAAVVRAFNSWEGHPCSDVFFDYEGTVSGALPGRVYDPDDDEPDGENLVIWLEDWPWGQDQLAQTRLIWNDRTGEILDADIFVNARDYYWSASDRVVTDIEDVLAHEIGHLLGFAHTTDPDATMYDGYTEGETLKRDLSGTDIRGLCEVYPVGAPTPGVPELSREDLELSSGACECSASPGRRPPPWLLALALAALGLRRRRGRR